MPGPRGPMGGGRTVEKPANFGNVMGKLVHYCRNYLPGIIIALVLGAAGTICQIIGPDKLKDMTNEIVKGLPAIVNGKPVMNSVDFNAVGRIAWLLNDRMVVMMIRGFAGDPMPPLDFWVAPVVGMLAWPFVFLLLDDLRARIRAKPT